MSDSRAADLAAIDAVMAESYKAWEAGDADGMVADYTEDATAIMPGSFRDGRAAVRDSMAGAFAGPLKGSWTHNRTLGTRFVGSDAAIVISEAGILLPGMTELPDSARVNCTWVLEKRDGEWKIAAYHNSPVAAGQ